MKPTPRGAAPKKRSKIPTPQRLKNIALYYLSRYAASEASLRRVLGNRMRRAKMAHPDFAADHAKQAECAAAIEQIVATHKESGAVNDGFIATMKVSSLRRSGKSQRFIQQKLTAAGLAKDLVASAITAHDGEVSAAEAETKAALALCKKRRIGPFRAKGRQKDTDRQKDFGILARAGFGAPTIRSVLNLSPDEVPDFE